MSPPQLTPVLICVALVLSAAAAGRHAGLRQILRPTDAALLSTLLAFATATSLIGCDQQVLFGNEYEDSYEYIATAELLAYSGMDWPFFYNPTCLAGPNSDCKVLGIASHPIGFASLLALVAEPRTGWPTTMIAVSLSSLARVITVVPLYLAALFTSRSRPIAFASAWTLCLFPIYSLYATTPMPVIFSTLLATVALLLWVLLAFDQRPTGLLLPGAFACVMIATILVRRDHLVLFAAAPAAAVLATGDVPLVLRRSSVLVIPAAMLWRLLDPAASGLQAASTHVGRFGLSYFVDLFPTFVASLGQRMDWYVALPLLALPALLFTFRSATTRFWGVILLAYVSLFAAFDHGFYYPRTGEVGEAHLGRYMTQALPALAVLAGVGACELWRAATIRVGNNARSYSAGGVLLAAWTLVAIGSFVQLRADRISFERSYRVDPAAAALRLMGQGDPIITMEPVVLHVVSNGTANAISLPLIGDRVALSDLIATDAHQTFYLRRGECEGIERQRHASACDALDQLAEHGGFLRRIQLSREAELILLVRRDPDVTRKDQRGSWGSTTRLELSSRTQ